jgi:hypothetical protein
MARRQGKRKVGRRSEGLLYKLSNRMPALEGPGQQKMRRWCTEKDQHANIPSQICFQTDAYAIGQSGNDFTVLVGDEGRGPDVIHFGNLVVHLDKSSGSMFLGDGVERVFYGGAGF